MEILDPKDDEYKMLDKYLTNTSHYYNLKTLDIWRIEREGESKTYNPLKLDNRKLLWHGSPFTNFVGILTNGMRIAPKEAPSTGYNFGKGAYFADLSGKSAAYCRTGQSNGIGLYYICEVAGGKAHQVSAPDHSEYLPKNCHIKHAVGRNIPNPKETTYIDNGKVEVPMGKQMSNNDSMAYMDTNEWIVYNTNQVKARYLLRFKM